MGLINKFLKSKHIDSLIVRLKAIEYKENILSYLSSSTSRIFLVQYFITFVEYQLVIDLLKRINYSNNFEISNIQIFQ